MPSSVSVRDGYLQIQSTKLDPPRGEFTIACGAVQSKAKDAMYGYYECRMVNSVYYGPLHRSYEVVFY